MSKRYNFVFFLYLIFFVFWNVLNLSAVDKNNESSQPTALKHESSSEYWFSIYYKDRYWFVDKNGKIYDVYRDYPHDLVFRTSPFISGITVNDETGKLDRELLSFIPKDIPKVIYEINLTEKYITTTKSSIIYLTDVEDIIPCSNVLKTVGEYLDSGKVFVFKNGKLYLL
uniref:DUF4894 domain-containing protein n=1 Tax=Fervidobacterium nodosum TaxID=2424 RepID=A0A7C5YA39_9BACT